MLRKSAFHLLSTLPKSSFGEHKDGFRECNNSTPRTPRRRVFWGPVRSGSLRTHWQLESESQLGDAALPCGAVASRCSHWRAPACSRDTDQPQPRWQPGSVGSPCCKNFPLTAAVGNSPQFLTNLSFHDFPKYFNHD